MAIDKPLLEINDLHVGFRIKDDFYDAVDGVSLSLEKNEILAIVGESGCGKSTLATTIMGLHNKLNTKITGDIIYNDVNLVNLNETLYNKIRGNDIGMIFQDPLASLNPLMTIGAQIDEALLYHTDLDEKQRTERVLELLAQVGIPNPQRTFKQYPHELSGGMRQRVVIAIALSCKPPIIIADEPTTALDVTIQAQILKLIRTLQQKLELTTIYITHDLGVVANVADRIAVMYAGDIIEVGRCEEIFYDAKHPYTWALLSSLPQLGIKGEDLYSITGTPPNLLQEIKGDAFAPRNPYALNIDFIERPPFFDVSPTHKARTWLLDPRAPKIDPPEAVQRLAERRL